MKSRTRKMKAGQVEMKVQTRRDEVGLEKKMEAGQERMEQVQEKDPTEKIGKRRDESH
ncbi:hypothetical protein AVEN_220943-1, partial [Araneus ventricosus]